MGQNSTPNYACTGCGRTFSTKFSARRHVTNVERGSVPFIPYAAYSAGLKSNKYSPPAVRPSYGKSQPEILADTYLNELAKEAARLNFKSPSTQTFVYGIIQEGMHRIDKKAIEMEKQGDRFSSEYINHIKSVMQNLHDP